MTCTAEQQGPACTEACTVTVTGAAAPSHLLTCAGQQPAQLIIDYWYGQKAGNRPWLQHALLSHRQA